MNAATLINQTSGETDYHTDPLILAAARAYLGAIDLDPASSRKANEQVQARMWYGVDPLGTGTFTDGLNYAWHGRLWINHPFGRKEPPCLDGCKKKHVHHAIQLHGNKAWIGKLFDEVENRNVTNGLCITYAATSERWFQPLLACPICFLSPRTNYYLPDGTVKKGVTKGSAIACFGRDMDLKKFIHLFRPFGQIKVNP